MDKVYAYSFDGEAWTLGVPETTDRFTIKIKDNNVYYKINGPLFNEISISHIKEFPQGIVPWFIRMVDFILANQKKIYTNYKGNL